MNSVICPRCHKDDLVRCSGNGETAVCDRCQFGFMLTEQEKSKL